MSYKASFFHWLVAGILMLGLFFFLPASGGMHYAFASTALLCGYAGLRCFIEWRKDIAWLKEKGSTSN